MDFDISLVNVAKFQTIRRTGIKLGVSQAEFGPIVFEMSGADKQLNVFAGTPAVNQPETGLSRRLEGINFLDQCYADSNAQIVDAKRYPLYAMGDDVTGSGPILNYRANHQGEFTNMSGHGYDKINYPVTLAMPVPKQWTVKVEHFHLTGIVLPPLSRH